MKKIIGFKTILRIFIICILFFNIVSCSNFFPYETVRDKVLFDHIEWDGTPYYLVEGRHNIPLDGQTLIIEETVYVIIVDENGNPYDVERKEEAWVFLRDPERKYIYFNNAYYTKDTTLASEHYGFNN